MRQQCRGHDRQTGESKMRWELNIAGRYCSEQNNYHQFAVCLSLSVGGICLSQTQTAFLEDTGNFDLLCSTDVGQGHCDPERR